MVQYLIAVKSQTKAQRTLKLLNYYGIQGRIMRLPSNVTGVGCGFCVKINENDLSESLSVLRQNNMAPAKVFIVYENGDYREMQV